MTEHNDPPDRDVPAFFESVLEGLPEAVIVAAPDGRITFLNPGAEALLGYRAAEVVGESITVLVPRRPERRVDPVRWLARWAAEPDPEPSRYLDMTAVRRDGQDMSVEVRVRQGVVGGQARYFITVRDTTSLRREQLMLKDANLRAARILMVAEDAIVSMDAANNIIFFNLAAERMFGYGAEEVIGRPLTLLMPPKARAAHAGHVEAFRLAKQASRMMSERAELRACRKDGETFPVEVTITKVATAGALTFTAHIRDVTARNRARDALRESERRVRAVFDHATEAIALLAPDGAVLEINRAGQGLTVAGQPVVGAPLWRAPWLGVDLAANPDATEPLREAVDSAAAGLPSRLEVELSPHGVPVVIDVRLTPVSDGLGKVLYILAEGRIGD